MRKTQDLKLTSRWNKRGMNTDFRIRLKREIRRKNGTWENRTRYIMYLFKNMGSTSFCLYYRPTSSETST